MSTGTPAEPWSGVRIVDLRSPAGVTSIDDPVLLDAGTDDASVLAGAARAGATVAVTTVARAAALVDAGASAGCVVVLLDLAPGVAAEGARLVAEGWAFGVTVRAVGESEADRGAAIGLLTVALQAGAVLVDTDDPRAARRVAAVVDAVRTAPAKARG